MEMASSTGIKGHRLYGEQKTFHGELCVFQYSLRKWPTKYRHRCTDPIIPDDDMSPNNSLFQDFPDDIAKMQDFLPIHIRQQIPSLFKRAVPFVQVFFHDALQLELDAFNEVIFCFLVQFQKCRVIV